MYSTQHRGEGSTERYLCWHTPHFRFNTRDTWSKLKCGNVPLNSFLRKTLKSSRPRRSLSSSNRLKDQRSTRILVGTSTLTQTHTLSLTAVTWMWILKWICTDLKQAYRIQLYEALTIQTHLHGAAFVYHQLDVNSYSLQCVALSGA